MLTPPPLASLGGGGIGALHNSNSLVKNESQVEAPALSHVPFAAAKQQDIPLVATAAVRFFRGSMVNGGDGPARGRSDIKAGDWIVIRSSQKTLMTMSEPELMGQIGVVSKVDAAAGAVEVHMPKLGLTARLQARFLSHLPDPSEGLRRARSTSTGVDELPPAMRRRTLTGLPGGSQAAHSEPHPPARVPPLVGRGLQRMRDVVRRIRKEMLSLEENIPWDCVGPSWKARRPVWRKGLRSCLPESSASRGGGASAATAAAAAAAAATAAAASTDHAAAIDPTAPLMTAALSTATTAAATAAASTAAATTAATAAAASTAAASTTATTAAAAAASPSTAAAPAPAAPAAPAAAAATEFGASTSGTGAGCGAGAAAGAHAGGSGAAAGAGGAAGAGPAGASAGALGGGGAPGVGVVSASAAERANDRAELPVALLAGAIADLHEALCTDKSSGMFARGGPWEARLVEMAEGGNNYVCLRTLWDDMKEGVHTWLSGPAPSNATASGAAAAGGGGGPGARGGGGARGGSGGARSAEHHQQQQAQQALPPGAADRLSTAAARRAVAALEAAALRGEAYVHQVPLDKILGHSPGGYAMLRGLIEQEKQFILSRIKAQAPVPAPQAGQVIALQ
ncbi:hypothetical protein FOA52_007389 [Chlamydomonas sp. UWO 241]|nr:hypothetical protein FOA52_007389 [Chlamydomonas sp. UWO 241]